MRRVPQSLLTKVERLVLDTNKPRQTSSNSSSTSTATTSTAAAVTAAVVEVDNIAVQPSTSVAFPLVNVDSAFPSAALSPERTPPSPCPSPVVIAAAQRRAASLKSTSEAYKACHVAFERICAGNSRKYAPAPVSPSSSLPQTASIQSTPEWYHHAVSASPTDRGADVAPLPVGLSPNNNHRRPSNGLPLPPADDYCVPVQWNGSEPATVFHSSMLPAISLADLGIMLAAQVPHCPAEMTIAAIVLARRYCSMTGTQVTAHMMHRLYLACLQLAIKAHCDHFVTSQDFARISGLSPKEMFRLEKNVLHGINWRAQVARAETQHLLDTATDNAVPSCMDDEVSWAALLSKPSPKEADHHHHHRYPRSSSPTIVHAGL